MEVNKKVNEAFMKQKGFTLVELLVAIGIIGILSSIAVVSVSNVRAKARDAKRVADVKQVQTALESYMNDKGEYPAFQGNLGVNNGGNVINKLCGDTSAGFQNADCAATTYMSPVPANPAPNTMEYKYVSRTNATPAAACTGVAGESCVSYKIYFKLESGAGTLPKGTYEANENGIVSRGDFSVDPNGLTF